MKRKCFPYLMLLCFLINQVAISPTSLYSITTTDETAQARTQIALVSPATLEIPETFGAKEEYFTAPEFSNDPRMIIHIKDLHCQYDAQMNISQLIKHLALSYKVGDVMVEGASGDVDTRIFGAFPDKNILDKVAKEFVKKGLITGPEYVSITQYGEVPLKLHGIEIPDLYIRNLKAFRDVFSHKEDTSQFVSASAQTITQLQQKVYSPELFYFTQQAAKMQKSEIKFSDFALYLTGILTKAGKDTSKWPNFSLLLAIVADQKTVDVAKVDEERNQVIEYLTQVMVKEDVEELVKKSLYFRLRRISSPDYFAFLKKLMDQYCTDEQERKNYQNLAGYFSVVKKQGEMKWPELLKEIADVQEEAKRSLLKTSQEKNIDHAAHLVDLLDKLFKLEWTRDDLAFYYDHKKEFDIANIAEQLREYCKKYDVAVDTLFENYNYLDELNNLLKYGEEFYISAVERDDALVNNALAKMEKEGINKAFMMAGGFHSKGIVDRLKERGISYVVVVPRVTEIDQESPYHQLMMDERFHFEEKRIAYMLDLLQTRGPDAVKEALSTVSIFDDMVNALSNYVQNEDQRKILGRLLQLAGPEVTDVDGFIEEWLGRNEEYFDKLQPKSVTLLLEEVSRVFPNSAVGALQVLKNNLEATELLFAAFADTKEYRFLSKLLEKLTGRTLSVEDGKMVARYEGVNEIVTPSMEKQLRSLVYNELKDIHGNPNNADVHMTHILRNLALVDEYGEAARKSGNELNAKEISILRTAVILHDIAKENAEIPEGEEGVNPVFRNLAEHHLRGARNARAVLMRMGMKEDFIREVEEVILRHMGPMDGYTTRKGQSGKGFMWGLNTFAVEERTRQVGKAVDEQGVFIADYTQPAVDARGSELGYDQAEEQAFGVAARRIWAIMTAEYNKIEKTLKDRETTEGIAFSQEELLGRFAFARDSYFKGNPFQREMANALGYPEYVIAPALAEMALAVSKALTPDAMFELLGGSISAEGEKIYNGSIGIGERLLNNNPNAYRFYSRYFASPAELTDGMPKELQRLQVAHFIFDMLDLMADGVTKVTFLRSGGFFLSQDTDYYTKNAELDESDPAKEALKNVTQVSAYMGPNSAYETMLACLSTIKQAADSYPDDQGLQRLVQMAQEMKEETEAFLGGLSSSEGVEYWENGKKYTARWGWSQQELQKMRDEAGYTDMDVFKTDFFKDHYEVDSALKFSKVFNYHMSHLAQRTVFHREQMRFAIKNSPLGSLLTPEQVNELAKDPAVTFKMYGEGDVIFKQGARSDDGVSVVLQGEIGITYEDENGHISPLGTRGVNTVIGESAIYQDTRPESAAVQRTANVLAANNVLVLNVSTEKIREMITRNQELKRGLEEIRAPRIQQLDVVRQRVSDIWDGLNGLSEEALQELFARLYAGETVTVGSRKDVTLRDLSILNVFAKNNGFGSFGITTQGQVAGEVAQGISRAEVSPQIAEQMREAFGDLIANESVEIQKGVLVVPTGMGVEEIDAFLDENGATLDGETQALLRNLSAFLKNADPTLTQELQDTRLVLFLGNDFIAEKNQDMAIAQFGITPDGVESIYLAGNIVGELAGVGKEAALTGLFKIELNRKARRAGVDEAVDGRPTTQVAQDAGVDIQDIVTVVAEYFYSKIRDAGSLAEQAREGAKVIEKFDAAVRDEARSALGKMIATGRVKAVAEIAAVEPIAEVVTEISPYQEIQDQITADIEGVFLDLSLMDMASVIKTGEIEASSNPEITIDSAKAEALKEQGVEYLHMHFGGNLAENNSNVFAEVIDSLIADGYTAGEARAVTLADGNTVGVRFIETDAPQGKLLTLNVTEYMPAATNTHERAQVLSKASRDARLKIAEGLKNIAEDAKPNIAFQLDILEVDDEGILLNLYNQLARMYKDGMGLDNADYWSSEDLAKQLEQMPSKYRELFSNLFANWLERGKVGEASVGVQIEDGKTVNTVPDMTVVFQKATDNKSLPQVVSAFRIATMVAVAGGKENLSSIDEFAKMIKEMYREQMEAAGMEVDEMALDEIMQQPLMPIQKDFVKELEMYYRSMEILEVMA